MKKFLILSILAVIPFFSFAQNSKNMNMKKKTLVAYFSCTGNTRQLAKTLQAATGGDLYEIKPQIPYTSADLDWQNDKSRSSEEMKDKASRPAIAGKLANMNDYEVVFVGFPIWWYIAPTIVNTFLESYDFSGKTVIPFCTSGSSQPGKTDEYLHSSCSKETHWRPAKRFPTHVSEATLKAWVEGLNL